MFDRKMVISLILKDIECGNGVFPDRNVFVERIQVVETSITAIGTYILSCRVYARHSGERNR